MKPVVTEKAVFMIETENVLTFEASQKMNKKEIKEKVEKLFDVEVKKVRTHIKGNKKYAYVKLNEKNPAIDIASKIGII